VINRTEDDFDGFILPNGEVVAIQDTDKIFSFLVKRREDGEAITRTLWGLAEECSECRYFQAAYDYFEKFLSLVDDPSDKAKCLLRMGQVMERAHNYDVALEAYSRAFELPQESNPVWYFLNNNLAFCLNLAGRHQEAERHCRAAIEIDPDRRNAHKNLGIALQNQGQYVEAAQCFIHATKLCPTDSRALDHLEDLLADHGEILEEIPDLQEQRQECHELVQSAEGDFTLQ